MQLPLRSFHIVVDAHQHFWTFGTYHQTSWMEVPPYAGDPAFQPLLRSFQPDDLMAELKAVGVHRIVTVEAADAPAENDVLLAIARGHDWIAGVVGWVPLAQPSEVERALDTRASQPAFVGVSRTTSPRDFVPWRFSAAGHRSAW